MTDRELLELAAKAAGLKNYRYYPAEDGLHACIEFDDEDDCRVVWMPLFDDGDALRLAVKLHLSVEIWAASSRYNQGVTIVDHDDGSIAFPHDSDPYESTRRAIVNTAAEIAKAM